MRVIHLTQGQVALVDDDDYVRLSQYKWFAHKNRNTHYAERNQLCENGKYKLVQMHKEVIDVPAGYMCDHIDHDGLNNQRSNLRIVTNRQNCQNKRMVGTSIYPGVHWSKRTKKWEAKIRIDGRHKYLGRYKNEKDAFNAYCDALRKINEVLI